MDKLKMHTANKVDENIEAIGRLFPNCVTERIVGYRDEKRPDGTKEPIIERAIDFDMLRQELSSVIVEGNEERYQFTWPDKKKAILLANAPIAKTLRPCREESVDFDNTENLYIEGDNLDVLKLLQETYLGKSFSTSRLSPSIYRFSVLSKSTLSSRQGRRVAEIGAFASRIDFFLSGQVN